MSNTCQTDALEKKFSWQKKVRQNWFPAAETLRLLRTSVSVLGEKIRMRAILKENTANYILLESLKNADFGKKYKLQFLQLRKRKSQTTMKMN